MVIQRLMGCFVGFSIKPLSPRAYIYILTRLLINSREHKILLCQPVYAPHHLYLFAFIHTLRQSLMTNRQRYDDNNIVRIHTHLYWQDFMSRRRRRPCVFINYYRPDKHNQPNGIEMGWKKEKFHNNGFQARDKLA